MNAGEQALRRWLEQRGSTWQKLAAYIDRPSAHALDVTQATEIVRGYHTVAADLALARQVIPDSRTRRALESLYGELHALVNAPATRWWDDLVQLVLVDAPLVIRALAPALVAVGAMFVLSALAGAWLVHSFPELVGLIASPTMIEDVESGRLWTEGLFNVTPSSVMSASIFANNVTVTVFAFAAGVFFGLGTFYIIGINGLMLGGVFAFTAQHGLAGRLFEFVIAHGLVEISVICIAGAAGMGLGEALARPRARSRRDAFQDATRRIGKLLVPCAALLLGAGLIEGYVSPNPWFPLWSHVAIGVCYWLAMFALLRGAPTQIRRSRRSRA